MYKNFLKSIDNEQIRHYIVNNTFVTGGAITSMLLNEEVNDYDIYFDNIHACKEVLRYFLKKMEKVENEDFMFHTKIDMENENEIEFDDRVKIYIPHAGIFKNSYYSNSHFPIFVSSNAMTLTDNIQLIFRFVGSPDEIHKNYDFEHTKCYYIPRTNELVLPHKAIESVLMKELTYTGSQYPLASVIRTRKFIQRGWNINAGQYLKMVIQLQDLDLNKPTVLSDQLTGVDLVLFEHVIKEIKKIKDIEGDITTDRIVEIVDRVFDNEGLRIDFEEYIKDKNNTDAPF